MLKQIWTALEFDEHYRRVAEQKYGIGDEKKDVFVALIGTGIEPSHWCFRDMETDLSIISREHEAKFLSLPYHRKVFGLWNFTSEALQEIRCSVSKSKMRLFDHNCSKDITGLGTACASVAVGIPYEFKHLTNVKGVSSPIIHGANPNARITSYKICGAVDAVDFDISSMSRSIMKMFDKIIADRPDVISVPFGSYRIKFGRFLNDPFGRGSLLALSKNITTCQAVGNTGPEPHSTLSAPWTISVGACTPGGRFETTIQIEEFATEEIMGFGSLNKDIGYHDLVIWRSKTYGDDQHWMPAELKLVNEINEDYEDLSLEELKTKLQDKIIFFDDRQAPSVEKLKKVGAHGIIKACKLLEFRNSAISIKVPIVQVTYTTGIKIIERYLASRENYKPMRVKFQERVYKEQPRALCSISSIGPNKIDSNILKPDVCGYGAEMLTASAWNDDNQYVNSQIFGGTSIASAMVTGSTKHALSPWIFSVGACTAKGYFNTTIELQGVKETFSGFGVNKSDTNFMDVVLWKVKAEVTQIEKLKLAENEENFDDLTTEELKLRVKDKIVICSFRKPFDKLYEAGVGGIICYSQNGLHNFKIETPMPVINVDTKTVSCNTEKLASSRKYDKATKARFLETKYSDCDCMSCAFSSAGPNELDPSVLKPDVCAYGQQVLAATLWNEDDHDASYMIKFGTSLACPMVAGVASFIKSIYPNWGPSRIKSAIMSTAKEVAFEKLPDVLRLGAGCVDPFAAIDPGLCYDIDYDEYVRYLINSQVKIEDFGIEPPENRTGIHGRDLNMCSFTTELGNGIQEYIFNRRLTNLSDKKCTFKYKIVTDERYPLTDFVSINVKPEVLVFAKEGEVLDFQLIVEKRKFRYPEGQHLEYAKLKWIEEVEGEVPAHEVCSPIILLYSNMRHLMEKKQGGSDQPGERPTKRSKGKEPMEEREESIQIPPESKGSIKIVD